MVKFDEDAYFVHLNVIEYMAATKLNSIIRSLMERNKINNLQIKKCRAMSKQYHNVFTGRLKHYKGSPSKEEDI